MGNCCECNKNSIDDGNIGGKIQYQNQITREERFRSQSKDNIMPNSANGNLSGFIDLQQTNNDTTQKDPDAQIPIKPPKVPHDKIPDSIINSKKKLKLIIKQSKYLSEGREFIINAGGLVGSPRNAKDGVTIFGDAGVNHNYINIINKINIFYYRIIIKMILNFLKKNQRQAKVMQKLNMTEI